jgi:anti-sigma factor RsiW
MRCQDIKDRADAYLEKELREDESIEFEDHLRACRNCQMEMQSIIKCIDMMKNVFSDKKPPSEIKKMVREKACCDEKERRLCCPPENEY